MNKKFHSFHMIELSPWPIMASLGIMSLVSSILVLFQYKMILVLLMSLLMMIMISFLWWKDIIRESLNQGYHFFTILKGLKMGMYLFIISEVFFFLSFFWGYFHSSMSPNIEIGQFWPPMFISSFNPMNVPLLNTIILLASGISITWCHHEIINNKMKLANISLILTILLGLYFSILQYMEYMESEFCMSSSVYGSSFFMATGFHGTHVLIGTSFLLICMIRLVFNHFSYHHHLGFEFAAWYWHFVDVVWLFLFMSIYWWGK